MTPGSDSLNYRLQNGPFHLFPMPANQTPAAITWRVFYKSSIPETRIYHRRYKIEIDYDYSTIRQRC